MSEILPALSHGIHIYIVDCSAIMENPNLESYFELYALERPLVLLLTLMALREIDEKKHKANVDYKSKFVTFITTLDSWQTRDVKLSQGLEINDKGDKVQLLRADLGSEEFINSDLSWMNSHGDKEILSLALRLKHDDHSVAILANDAGLGILAREFDVKYIRVQPLFKHLDGDSSGGHSTLIINKS